MTLRGSLREAFQSKTQGKLGNVPNKGGAGVVSKNKKVWIAGSKKQKILKFQLGNVQIKGGGDSSDSSRGYQRLKNNDSFSSYGDPNT